MIPYRGPDVPVRAYIHCREHDNEFDLLLVRGLDMAGGPQVWHAYGPPGVVLCRGFEARVTPLVDPETSAHVHIVWEIVDGPFGRVAFGPPRPLARTNN